MLVSVNTARIQSHLSILQEEKREAARLVEYLYGWYELAVLAEPIYANAIKENLRTAENQEQYIQNRIDLLESIVSRFSNVLQQSESLIDMAKAEESSFGIP